MVENIDEHNDIEALRRERALLDRVIVHLHSTSPRCRCEPAVFEAQVLIGKRIAADDAFGRSACQDDPRICVGAAPKLNEVARIVGQEPIPVE